MLGTVYAELELIDGLKYKSLVGVNFDYIYNYDYTPAYVAGEFHNNEAANIGHDRRDIFSPVFTNSLTYSKNFSQHSLDATAVIEYQKFTSRRSNTQGENPISNFTRQPVGTINQSISGDKQEWALISYIGRVNYSFADKYLLTASIRRDGSSRFSPGNKWGVFPSVSVGWRLSEESFMAGINSLSDLKLRASWGEVGNNSIANYDWQATINSNYLYNFNNNLVAGSTIPSLANTDLTWETTTMINVGADIGLFEDRLTASIEYFNNETRDMLIAVPIPKTFGFSGDPFQNSGSVRNTGLEFALGYQDVIGDFQWSVNANMSTVNNEVISLAPNVSSINGPTFEGDAVTWTNVGDEIGYLFGWKVDRILQEDDFDTDGNLREGLPTSDKDPSPGDILFQDINDDGIIDANDRTKLGNPFPDLIYGLNFSANYKNFDFTLFIQGTSGNEVYNTQVYDLQGMVRVFNAGVEVLDRWTPTNTNTNIPRGVSRDPNDNSRASDRYVQDGSYMRIKNLAIGYNLPANLLNNLTGNAVKRARVYLSSQNLLTLTGYEGYDPEIGLRDSDNPETAGVDNGSYPLSRQYTLGLQVSF